jgi:hypothetical protein
MVTSTRTPPLLLLLLLMLLMLLIALAAVIFHDIEKVVSVRTFRLTPTLGSVQTGTQR